MEIKPMGGPRKGAIGRATIDELIKFLTEDRARFPGLHACMFEGGRLRMIVLKKAALTPKNGKD